MRVFELFVSFTTLFLTAGSWCRALEASGLSCRDAHGTWRALAARVFPDDNRVFRLLYTTQEGKQS